MTCFNVVQPALSLESELEEHDKGKSYMSHHTVIEIDSKTTPCRIVFNSSDKYEGKSLNDYLAKRPSLLNGIFGIVLGFRFMRYALVDDIKKMFNYIDIPLKISLHTYSC